jgi:hypothetical protein
VLVVVDVVLVVVDVVLVVVDVVLVVVVVVVGTGARSEVPQFSEMACTDVAKVSTLMDNPWVNSVAVIPVAIVFPKSSTMVNVV